MRKLSLLLSLFLLVNARAYAEQTYSYQTYLKNKKKTLSESSIRFDFPQREIIHMFFAKEEGGSLQTEKYTFNGDYETIQWSVLNESESTDYTGMRMDNQIIVEGTFKGKKINKRFKIDDDPFYAFPKFELKPFVLSEKQECSFWAMRNDKLTMHKMIGSKEGEEMIQLGGKSLLAKKVFWTTANPLFRLFKRTYYFRASDGLFVKQEYSDGRVRELILGD